MTEPVHIERETGRRFSYTGPPCCPYCGHGLAKEHGGIPTVEYLPEPEKPAHVCRDPYCMCPSLSPTEGGEE